MLKIIFGENFEHLPVKITKLAVNAKIKSKKKTLWGFPTVVKMIIKGASHKRGYRKHGMD